jgi:hypothetical protein
MPRNEVRLGIAAYRAAALNGPPPGPQRNGVFVFHIVKHYGELSQAITAVGKQYLCSLVQHGAERAIAVSVLARGGKLAVSARRAERFGVRPTCAPTAREWAKRCGWSSVSR